MKSIQLEKSFDRIIPPLEQRAALLISARQILAPTSDCVIVKIKHFKWSVVATVFADLPQEEKPEEWFRVRTGKQVLAYSHSHNEFNGQILIVNNAHAVFLYDYAQRNLGYRFADVTKIETVYE